jgi:hypothetical protein
MCQNQNRYYTDRQATVGFCDMGDPAGGVARLNRQQMSQAARLQSIESHGWSGPTDGSGSSRLGPTASQSLQISDAVNLMPVRVSCQGRIAYLSNRLIPDISAIVVE